MGFIFNFNPLGVAHMTFKKKGLHHHDHLENLSKLLKSKESYVSFIWWICDSSLKLNSINNYRLGVSKAKVTD